MLSVIERYRRYQFSSLQTAQETDDPRLKKQMLDAAELWKELAEKELENWNDPVYRAKQRSAERERKLAEIDAAIAALNRSNATDSEQTETRFAERAGEQLQRVLNSGHLDGRP
jgi:hypothetical protein